MKLGFRSKIYIGTLSLLLVLAVSIFLVVSRIMTDALLEENHNRGITICTNLAARMTEPMLAVDFLLMKTLVDETVTLSDDIYYTFVLDAAGEPLVHSFKGGFPTALKTVNPVSTDQAYRIQFLDTGDLRIYDFAVPVLIGEDRFGTVRIGLLRTRIKEAIARLMWSGSVLTGLAVLIAGFVGAAMAQSVTRRIKILHESSQQVLRGNLEVQTAPRLKKNCWEIMACENNDCPAYGNHGHRCWYLAGTLCPTCVEGEFARKISTCHKCTVYRRCSGDEIQSLAESFDSMTLSMNTHLSDLTDTQRTLKEQGNLLRTILDASPDFVSLQDRDLVYRAANQAFCKILSKEEKEIVGRSNEALFPPEQAERYSKEDRIAMESGRPLIKENVIETRKGNKWLHVMKIPVRDAEDQITGLLGSCRDITEFKKMQEQLTQAQKMETVGQLTAGIAHEINTPLGIILGYAQLLLEDAKKGSQSQEDLTTIVKHTRICRKIVSDLLSFSRHTQSTVARVDLNRSIREVIAVVEHTFSLDGVSVTADLEADLPFVKGDEEKIKQVWANLFSNARDAIGNRGVIAVQTLFNPVDKAVVIHVADTGEGIRSDRIDRIFDPFFTTKSPGRGTGLGLSVTFGIVKEHGGQIEVESPVPSGLLKDMPEPGGGTLFAIHLPIYGPAAQKEEINGDDTGSG